MSATVPTVCCEHSYALVIAFACLSWVEYLSIALNPCDLFLFPALSTFRVMCSESVFITSGVKPWFHWLPMHFSQV